MIYSNKGVNETAKKYADELGYIQKKNLYDCIIAGDLDHLDQVLDTYFEGLDTLVKGNLAVAQDSMRYIWPQINAYVTQTMLTNGEARSIQEKYYYELAVAETVDDVYRLGRTLAREFTEAISLRIKENTYSALVKNSCQYINGHVYDRITVSSLAETMHFSASYLSHKFKEETGITVEHYVQKAKINEAKLLLRTNMPISAIASSLGFSSQSHFTEAFRKEVGTTPKVYRAT